MFRLSPNFRIYRAKSDSCGAFQYLNISHGLGTTAFSHGLGLGGNGFDQFRVFIPESFEDCTASSTGGTFEVGMLVPGEKFEIDTIEIWGVGGADRIEHGMHALEETRLMKEKSVRQSLATERSMSNEKMEIAP